MAKLLSKLTDRQVKGTLPEGRHSDGGGLFLAVSASGARRWVFLYRWKQPGETGRGKLREMGLGSVKAVDLAEARAKAAGVRKLLDAGTDPLAVVEPARPIPTFGHMADELIAAKDYRSDKSLSRIKYALEHHAARLRGKTVDKITEDDVKAVLDPIWRTTPIMAEKVRGYIWQVMENANDHYAGRNPATWTGRLERRLPKRKRLKVGNYPSLPYDQIRAFMAALNEVADEEKVALEFLILTGTRTTEVRMARWSEIDLDTAVWTLPKGRTKSDRQHRVPLSSRALAILRSLRTDASTPDDFVFPFKRLHGTGGVNIMNDIVKAMNGDKARWVDPDQDDRPIVPHGFRSTFREWAEFEAGFSFEMAEQAIAHVVGDATVRSYRRRDPVDKRRAMMEAWAAYIGGGGQHGGNVVPIRQVGAA